MDLCARAVPPAEEPELLAETRGRTAAVSVDAMKCQLEVRVRRTKVPFQKVRGFQAVPTNATLMHCH